MILIKNIGIVSMKDDSVSKNKSIIIEDGIIKEICNTFDRKQKFNQIIDGTGKYIMPGIINMHTHLGDNKDDLLLYLANGVTSIRNMWGYEKFSILQWIFGTRVFNHLKLKKQIEKGEVVGPRIFTAGPLLDGKDPFFPKFLKFHSVSNRNQIEKIIKEQARKGYDFIKIYNKLSKQNFDDIMEVANTYNIPVAGHVPDDVGLEDVLKSGVRSIEHLYGFVNAYMPEQNVKDEDMTLLANLASKNKVCNCPTLIANYRLANVEKRDEFEKEEQMKYVSKRIKKGMRILQNESDKFLSKQDLVCNHSYMEKFHKIIQALRNEGAEILVGTDKAVPYVVAGFSEHIEMQMLKDAGLSNYEVIKAATISAAKCLDQENNLGTVEIGKNADLIITDENPLNNLETIKNHNGVISNGVFYSREKCDDILNKIRNKVGEGCYGTIN